MKSISLLAALILMAAAPAPAPGQDVDALGMERAKCRDLRNAGELDRSFECASALWSTHREDMTLGGKVEVLAQLAELYSVAQNPAEAQRCYRAILSFDPHWLPDNFDSLPTSWRDPILEAYRARGSLVRSKAVTNVAVLDFQIADLKPDDVKIDALAQTLPSYISAYLQNAVDGTQLKEGTKPLKLVSHRDRAPLMAEIARAMGMEQNAVVHGEMPVEGLVEAGKAEAIQAFLSGTIIRDFDGKVQIAMYLLDVETGQARCAQVEDAKSKELFSKLQDVLMAWADCTLEGAELKDRDGTESLGPIAQGVAALEQYHEALVLAEQERFEEALLLARGALQLRPDSADLERLVQQLLEQQELAGLALQGTPSPVDLQ